MLVVGKLVRPKWVTALQSVIDHKLVKTCQHIFERYSRKGSFRLIRGVYQNEYQTDTKIKRRQMDQGLAETVGREGPPVSTARLEEALQGVFRLWSCRSDAQEHGTDCDT